MNADDDDAALVAFIDGELDEPTRRTMEARLASETNLRERLALLQDGGRPFAAAFQTLLEQAPVARLKASLPNSDDAIGQSPARRSPMFRLSRLGAAAAIVLFGLGVAVGRLGPALLAPVGGEVTAGDQQEDWRQAVAEYMALYTSDTFDAAGPAGEGELAAVGAKIGLTLNFDRIALNDVEFRDAQILNYEGAPLGELAYVDPASGPLLFCIIRNSEPDSGAKSENRRGFAVISWAKAGRGYMLIGRLPATRMAELADSLRRRF
jgi:anti-sigma factor RsiW